MRVAGLSVFLNGLISRDKTQGQLKNALIVVIGSGEHALSSFRHLQTSAEEAAAGRRAD